MKQNIVHLFLTHQFGKWLEGGSEVQGHSLKSTETLKAGSRLGCRVVFLWNGIVPSSQLSD